MKITIKNGCSKECLEEAYFITLFKKLIRKNPRKKARRITSYSLRFIYFWIFMIFTYYWFYTIIGSIVFIYVVGIFSLELLLYLINYSNAKKIIKLQLEEPNKEELIHINKEGIDYFSKNINIKYTWNELQYVIINKYSIFIIPKSPFNTFIFFSTDIKETIIKALEKYDRKYLLVDNSNKYNK